MSSSGSSELLTVHSYFILDFVHSYNFLAKYMLPHLDMSECVCNGCDLHVQLHISNVQLHMNISNVQYEYI